MTTNTKKENYTSEVEKNSEDKLSEMQSHLVTNVGLSIGVISTIIFVTKTKAFISSYLRYIIICLVIYSFVLIVTGTGEYIEKFIRLQKNNEYKELSNWDYTMSITYMGLSLLMLTVIVLLFVSIIRDKLI
tara:strand:- start:175 stop:567 length:393 start_codon:yes stop_codon:yes gene_type:complete